jgi:ubiquinone/menaquinone biosynthesis C-methylase UbiE
MKWIRKSDRDAENASGSTNHQDPQSGLSEHQALLLPGGVADESVSADGQGFVLLGGSQNAGGAQQVAVDENGYAFIDIDGRRLIANMPDMLPKDAQEYQRLDHLHFLLQRFLPRIEPEPFAPPSSILDVGCGTSRWALEIARTFPQASVIGLDIVEPTWVNRGTLPRTYRFLQANVLDGLPFPDAAFDLTHMRLLFLGIPAHLWPSTLTELVRVTRPGGRIEIVEGDLPQNGGYELDVLLLWITEAARRRGIDVHMGSQVGQFLREAQAVDVVTRTFAVPLEKYAGHSAEMTVVNTFALLESLRAVVVLQGIASGQQYDYALAAARSALLRTRTQCVLPYYFASGKRPG